MAFSLRHDSHHSRFEKTALIFISAILLTDVDRLRGYEMARWITAGPVIPEVLRAKVKVFVELFRKTRQLEQLNRELEARVAERTSALAASACNCARANACAAWRWQPGKWAAGNGTSRAARRSGTRVYAIYSVSIRYICTNADNVRPLINPEDFELLVRAFRNVTKDANTFQTEFRVRRPNEDVRWCTGTAAARFDESGRLIWISGVTADVTDRKRAEERQILLAEEVDHRARNVVAVVQSIMRLTRAESIDDYMSALDGRIGALSNAHRLLAGSRWEAPIWDASSRKNSRRIGRPERKESRPRVRSY